MIPPAMPRTQVLNVKGKQIDYYEIAVKQFQQYILPQAWSEDNGIEPTTVWSYASMIDPRPVAEGGTLNYPAFTIEAQKDRPVRVKWINGLVDDERQLPAAPLRRRPDAALGQPAGRPRAGTDSHGTDADAVHGPVPIVTHVHGAHATEDSDGYPEAWFLPAANNIPAGYATSGTYYDQFKQEFEARWGSTWEPGTAVFQYPNDQRATTLWYHDHTLGMTRAERVRGPGRLLPAARRTGDDLPQGVLPGPAPQRGDAAGTKYYEIPIAIQDRSFNADGSLFYPDNRAFFEGLNVPASRSSPTRRAAIPFIPDEACGGQTSDVSPIWNPEFFGNTMVVNGKTWPYLDVEPRRYRFRLLNGCQLAVPHPQAEQRHAVHADRHREAASCPQPVQLRRAAHRARRAGRRDRRLQQACRAGPGIILLNIGPDEPFGGGTPARTSSRPTRAPPAR